MPTQELSPYDPAQVGPYRLRGRLGSGGMGVVYLADAPDGSHVALKCLAPGVGDEVRQRLRREAELLAAVTHPRVVRYIAADVHGVRPWLAMQYIAGPCLAEASVPLGPAQVRHLTEGLADALRALHRQGVCHRDVKPGNIILTHDGPVLVDLGIASGTHLTSLTAVGMVVGTPAWMAPEQITGLQTGAYTDVWGWACVAVYAATGRTPFGDGPVIALADRIRHAPPDLTGVPDWLAGAVDAALAKDVRARPNAEQLAGVDGIRKVGAARSVRREQVPPRAVPAGTALLPSVQGRPPRPGVRAPVRSGSVRSGAARQGPVRQGPATPDAVDHHPMVFTARPFVAPPRPAAPRSRYPAPASRSASPEPAAPPSAYPAAATSRPAPHPVSTRPQKGKRPRPAKPPPPVRRRRPLHVRIFRTLLWLVLAVVVAVLAGVGAYLYVLHHLHGGTWGDAVRRVRDLLPGH